MLHLARGRRAARLSLRGATRSRQLLALMRQEYQHLLRHTQRRYTRSQAITLTELACSTNSKKVLA